MKYKKPIQLGIALAGFALAAYTLPAATTYTHSTDSVFTWEDTAQWTPTPGITGPNAPGDTAIVNSGGTATRLVTIGGTPTIGTLLSGKGGTWNAGVAPSRYFNFSGTINLDNTGGVGKPTVGGANSAYGNSVYNCIFSGSQGVRFWRNVTIGVGGNNTFTGDVDIEDATTVRILNVNALPFGARTGNVNFTLTQCALDLWGNSITINGLNAATGVGHKVTQALNAGSVTLTVGDNNQGGNFGGVIENGTGTMSLAKTGTGTQTLGGANTYTGNTTINSGGGVGGISLASGAQLTIKVQGNGVNNQITGDNTGKFQLDGKLNFDLSGADLTLGNTWNVVDIANVAQTVGGTFSPIGNVGNGFYLLSPGFWNDIITDGTTLQYNQSSGMLTVIPEPATLVLGLAGGLGLLVVIRRRRLT